MLSLSKRRILLGVTGGIAAYKSAELIRRLKDQGADVRVVMTPAAQEFITPLTLQALSGNPVHTSLLDPAAEAAMGHIELARWGDLILVAPASADFMARLTHGLGNDLLTTLCLAARCPIAVAPAMNQAMWSAPATQHNVGVLKQRKVAMFGPAQGEQACGDVGYGRMLEPDQLVSSCVSALQTQPQLLKGKRVLLTAGPTREAIDPVRYISNHSSGKMGYALAAAAQDLGASVTLVSGPVALTVPEGVTCYPVISAQEMLDTVLSQLAEADIFIATAAVADFRVEQVDTQKIKKQDTDSRKIQLNLIENPDILATVCAQPTKPFAVGFAAETQNVMDYARQKLQRKRLDMIVANDVSNSDIGFNSEQNEVTVIWPSGEKALPKASKNQLAYDILRTITEQMTEQMQKAEQMQK